METAPQCDAGDEKCYMMNQGDSHAEDKVTSTEIITIIVLFCFVGLWAAQRSWSRSYRGRIPITGRIVDATASFLIGVPLFIIEIAELLITLLTFIVDFLFPHILPLPHAYGFHRTTSEK